MAVAVVVITSCAPPSPSELPSSRSDPPTDGIETTAPSTTQPSRATASPSAVLEIDRLPVAVLEPSTTALCDAEPDLTDPEAGHSEIFCVDSLVVAMRAMRTITAAPVDRMYFRRPECSAIPCSADELSTGSVFSWTGGNVLVVAVDARLTTVGVPAVTGGDAIWPIAGSLSAPAVHRPDLAGAPRDLSDRTPYPYCGLSGLGGQNSVRVCFRDAVLSGRPAEMLQGPGGNGDPSETLVFRFDGGGAVYEYSSNSWRREDGSMILNPTPRAWDFEGWIGQ